MATSIKVDPIRPATLELTFTGVCRYSAALYERDPTQASSLRRRLLLEADGSSEDARWDTFDFDAPPSGTSYFIRVTGEITTMSTTGAAVEVRFRILQDNVLVGEGEPYRTEAVFGKAAEFVSLTELQGR